MNALPASDALAPYGAAFESARTDAGETEAVRSQAFARFAEAWFPGRARRGMEVHEPAAPGISPLPAGTPIAGCS